MSKFEQEKNAATRAPIAPAMFSIKDWCARNGQSRSGFYKMHAEGRGPEIVKVGRRSFITAEADKAWREGLPRFGTHKSPGSRKTAPYSAPQGLTPDQIGEMAGKAALAEIEAKYGRRAA